MCAPTWLNPQNLLSEGNQIQTRTNIPTRETDVPGVGVGMTRCKEIPGVNEMFHLLFGVLLQVKRAVQVFDLGAFYYCFKSFENEIHQYSYWVFMKYTSEQAFRVGGCKT